MKPVPVMVMEVPPAVGPEVGEMPVTVGGDGRDDQCKCCGIVDCVLRAIQANKANCLRVGARRKRSRDELGVKVMYSTPVPMVFTV
jgi:hypothetical protein